MSDSGAAVTHAPRAVQAPRAPRAPKGGHARARDTANAYARGLAGGLLVGTPVLMTMEVWWGGFTIPALRLLVLVVVNFGVLLVLQHYSGLHPNKTRWGQVRAALVAYGLGLVVAGLMLAALWLLHDTTLRDAVGKLVLEAVPVSIGSSVAMSEFEADNPAGERRRDEDGLLGALGMALAGSMLFGFSIAATEEPVILGMQIPPGYAIVLVILSVLQVHGIVYAVQFQERTERQPTRRWWRLVLREGVATYMVALLVAAYVLWTFGRIGVASGPVASLEMVVVLGLVTSLGAAAAELLI